MCKELTAQLPIALIVDFHGHSKMQNIFMYGNTDADNPSLYYLFPYIVSQECDLFSFKSSRFGVQKSKLSTARIALWKIINNPYVYTIESSFYKSDITKDCFSIKDLMRMGQKLCESIVKLHKNIIVTTQSSNASESPTQDAMLATAGQIQDYKNNEELQKLLELLKTNEYSPIQNAQSDSGSDSNPSEDDLINASNLISPSTKKSIRKNKSKASLFSLSENRPKGLAKSKSQVPNKIKILEQKGKFIKTKKMYTILIRSIPNLKSPALKSEKTAEYVAMVDRAMQTDDDPYAMEVPLQVEMVPPNSNNSFNSDILRQIQDEEKKSQFSESK